MCCFIKQLPKEMLKDNFQKKIKFKVTTQAVIAKCYESSLEESSSNLFKNMSTEIF